MAPSSVSNKGKLPRNHAPDHNIRSSKKSVKDNLSNPTKKSTSEKKITRKTAFSKKVITVEIPYLKSEMTLEKTAEIDLQMGTKLFASTFISYIWPELKAVDQVPDQTPDFQAAYIALLKAIPPNNRLALLRQMHRDIEVVARAELNVTPSELGGEENDSLATEDFMAALERQEVEQRGNDIATGKLLSGTEMRARLGVSAQALSAALKAKRIFALQGVSGEYIYPAFFADPTYDRPVLEKICKALGDLPAGSKWDFFTNPRISLNGWTPLDALAKGKVAAVMAAAIAFTEE